MRKFLLATSAIAALVMAAPASAADIPVKARPLPPPVPRCAQFGGFYIGGNVGGAVHNWRVKDLDSFSGNIDGELPQQIDGFSSGGFVGGGQVGYNGQWGCTVFGLEADWNWANLRSSEVHTTGDAEGFDSWTVNTKVDWFGTLRTRYGLVVDNLLLYVTGGAAFAKIRHTNSFFSVDNCPGSSPCSEEFAHSDTRWGWTAGVGGEWAWTPNLSIKAEVLYAQFRPSSFVFNSVVFRPNDHNPWNFKFEDSMWVTRIGLNYRFGGGGYY
jgi:outer membrane immunogenic protein